MHGVPQESEAYPGVADLESDPLRTFKACSLAHCGTRAPARRGPHWVHCTPFRNHGWTHEVSPVWTWMPDPMEIQDRPVLPSTARSRPRGVRGRAAATTAPPCHSRPSSPIACCTCHLPGAGDHGPPTSCGRRPFAGRACRPPRGRVHVSSAERVWRTCDRVGSRFSRRPWPPSVLGRRSSTGRSCRFPGGRGC